MNQPQTILTPTARPSGRAPWVQLVRVQSPGGLPAPDHRYTTTTPLAVWKFYQWMERLEVECFCVLLLDAQHKAIAQHEVTRGILNSSLIHPREVFRVAIALGAASLVCVHNHPSGDITPSSDDRAITSQLVAAGRLLDIPVHDHIIVGYEKYFSFAVNGML